MTIFVYTEKARAFAEGFDGGLGALQAAVDHEIEEFLKEHQVEKITDIFFHTMSWNGNLNILMAPRDAATLVIDIVDDDNTTRITVESGPLEGKTLVVPLPFT